MLQKKSIRFALIVMFALLTLFGAVSVSAAGTVTTGYYSATLKKDIQTVKKNAAAGEVIGLKLKYSGSVVNNTKVAFRSSKPSVASVSPNGVIVAKKKGTATITAVFRKRGVRFKIKVREETAQTADSQAIPDDVIIFTSDEDDFDDEPSPAETASYSALRKKMVAYAESFVGRLRYVWAGNSLVSGTDCSGFIHLIYAQFGLDAPRSASDFQRISNIEYDDLMPGDIVVYKNGGHVALFIGDDMIVHCKGSNYGTVKEKMWYGTPTGYVRLIND